MSSKLTGYLGASDSECLSFSHGQGKADLVPPPRIQDELCSCSTGSYFQTVPINICNFHMLINILAPPRKEPTT